MFILRRIKNENGEVETNATLGHCYTIVTKLKNPVAFENAAESLWKGYVHNPESKIYAFITNGLGDIIPIFNDEDNYIMTESGKTFTKISYK